MLRALACVFLVLVGGCKSDRRPATTTRAGSATTAGAGAAASAAAARPMLRDDPHSQARPDRVAVRHLTLGLEVDFDTRQLSGTAALQLVRHDPTATEVVLDVDDLTIESVVDCASKQPLEHTLGAPARIGGQALTVQLAGDCIVVAYRTAPTAKALLWVDPAGTAGKQHPMLFTQSQAILARTWIPLQDSPGVRFTYDATIRIPDGMWALMSATNPQAPPADGVWRFAQEHPIPSYLMALAVGDFAFRAIGPRTGVYAEPSVVEAAAHEFAEVDAMMAAAEKLYGPYRWGRYDMLVLPPSFPFGGMENPRLTFLTPTVISGDRSLVSLIAHELAHSWSGNLVTSSTWNDLWLNEGFTTYVERRIMEELRGKETADVGWALGRKDLEETLDEVGRTNPDTRLALDFSKDRSPEEAPGDIAYEKGSLLLRAMELAFGREAFDAFLRERFDRLAFQSTDSRAFEAAAAPLFAAHAPGWTLADWLHQPALPPTAPPSTSTRVAALERQAIALAKTGALPDASAWDAREWTAFLRALPATTSRARLAALDKKYELTASPNAVIGMRWLPILIRADIRAAAPTVEAYVIRVGRRWLVRTVYEAMIAKNEFWRALAAKAFEKAKPGYHAVTRDTIAGMLAKQPG